MNRSDKIEALVEALTSFPDITITISGRSNSGKEEAAEHDEDCACDCESVPVVRGKAVGKGKHADTCICDICACEEYAKDEEREHAWEKGFEACLRAYDLDSGDRCSICKSHVDECECICVSCSTSKEHCDCWEPKFRPTSGGRKKHRKRSKE